MLLVRERAPLRLAASIATPSGRITRWAADEHRAETAPADLTFSSTMPGGFEQCSLNLPRKPDLNYQDLDEFSTLTVSGAGGQGAWQGRLERTPRVSGDRLAVSPGLVGWQAHLDDNQSAQMIYVDRDLSRWGQPSVARQLSLINGNAQLGTSQVGPDPTSGTPAVVQSITDSWTTPWLPFCEAWYDAGSSNLIATVWYDVAFTTSLGGNTNFNAAAYLSSDANATTTETSGNLYTTPFPERSGYFTPATAYRFALLQLFFAVTGAGVQGAQYSAMWKNGAVYGNHGLTGRGTDPVGFYASDVIAHALATWAPKLSFTTGASGTIQPTTFIIPHLAFTTSTTASEIVKQATRFELYDWAVWEGPTFYYAPHGTFGRNWKARVGPSGLQENGPQVDRIWNGVIVQYGDVTGDARTVGPVGSGADVTDSSLTDSDPLNAANVAGVRRWTKLSMGTSTSAAAIKVGQAFLAEQKLLNTSGDATLVGHVTDDHGVLWPAWKVRAGDTITFVDAHDTTARRIIRAEYADSSKTCQISLDSPPDGLQALLERLSVSIVPLGFS